MNTNLPTLLTLGEVAEALRMSRESVKRFADLGKLPAPIQIGRKCRWKRETIEALLDGEQVA
jgi:excisionase family DNA binding protein